MAKERSPVPDNWFTLLMEERKRVKNIRKGRIEGPVAVGMVGEVARVFCPESNVYLDFEIVFPSSEIRERFLGSRKRRQDLDACGGFIIVKLAVSKKEDPFPQESGMDGVGESKSAHELATIFKLRFAGEFIDAENAALKELSDYYNRVFS